MKVTKNMLRNNMNPNCNNAYILNLIDDMRKNMNFDLPEYKKHENLENKGL